MPSSANKFGFLLVSSAIGLFAALSAGQGHAQGITATELRPVPLSGDSAGRATGIGILDPGRNGGMDISLWQGTDAGLITTMIGGISANTQVPVVRDLARRVLSSTARPPEGAGSDFDIARVKGLLRLGYFRQAQQLAHAIAPRQPAAGDRLRATAALLDGNASIACDTLRETDRDNDTADGFWDRIDLFCQIEEGNSGAVNFLSNILREAGSASEDMLAAAAALAAGTTLEAGFVETELGTVDPIDTPVAFVLLAKAGLALGPDASLLQRAVWLNQQLSDLKSVDGALTTLIDLARAGWLSDSELRDGFKAAGFVSADLADPLADPAAPVAVLLAAADAESLEAIKTQLIARAWEQARPIEGALLPYFAGIIRSLQPAPGTEAIAPAAFMLLHGTGSVDEASLWLRQAGTHPATQVGNFARQLAMHRTSTPVLANQPELQTLQPVAKAITAGLGLTSRADILASQFGGNDVSAAALAVLHSSGNGTQGTGQALLATLLLTGDKPLATLSPFLLMETINTLVRLGLVEEAQTLAQHAILATATDQGIDGIDTSE